MARPNGEEFADDQCFICGFDNAHALEEHHIVPRSIGGSDSEENLAILCSNCHSALSTLYSRWFFRRVWNIFEEMDHPPDLVKHNLPKGLQYNEKNRLEPDYEDGYEDIVKALELLERGIAQREVAKRCDLARGTVRQLDLRHAEKRELYYQFIESRNHDSTVLTDWE